MRLHSYIVEHDHGFAPNPFHGTCTLATCKPRIRKYAALGDFIIGTGTKKRGLQSRLVYIMRVSGETTFDSYWSDPSFARKKPRMNGSFIQRYGDNIYHRDSTTGEWLQADSFHSREGGVLDPDNLDTDTSLTDRVLIGDWFIYWGGDGPLLVPEFADFVQTTQGHKSIRDEARIECFLRLVKSSGQFGPVGDPYEWRFLNAAA